jgi:hypothetical protein
MTLLGGAAATIAAWWTAVPAVVHARCGYFMVTPRALRPASSTTRPLGLGWIARHGLTGILTEYEADDGCYDLAVYAGRFRDSKPITVRLATSRPCPEA